MTSARYEVLVTRRFQKSFKTLDHETQSRIKKTLPSLASDPSLGKPLHGPLKLKRSLRVGKYRVVYEVDEKRKVVTLFGVGPRKGIYDNI
ncbi:MAG: type II toxin-antitoxin system RelE/ParE family toxin [Nanoarchaeota archaeon]|nr:type II toxin-antitoxin system RelE/ParE family toxin [Nanoarchaeota archaeon]